MPWRLERTRPAIRDMEHMPEDDRLRVEFTFARLLQDPGQVSLAKLGGRRDEWRVRVGSWRAIVQLDTATGVIRVLRVLPRGRAYRD